jgi:phospholipid/cholesterol/gamma-HCH transport system substrate-binding protein
MARGGSRSFLERSQRLIGAIGIILIIVGTVLALMLQGGLLKGRYRVTASFTDAAGIRAGDYVTVAGLQAGRVEEVRVGDGAAVMELAVDEEVELSSDSRAEIVIETLLGRRSVSLVSGRGEGLLAEGDVIPIERTTTPVDITELNDVSVRLLEASDADAFEQLMEELTAVTEGKAQDVRSLIVGLNDVLRAVNSRGDELEGLIDSLRTLSTTLGQRDTRIVSLIDNLNVVLANLASRQEQLTQLLVNTDVASHETADLVRRNRSALDSTIRSLTTDLKVLNRHQLDLAATISYLNQAVQGYSSVGYSFGAPNEWANIFVQSLGPAGVDSLIGQCGAVDQLFDEFFSGADCATSPPRASAPPATAPVDPSSTSPVPGIDVEGVVEDAEDAAGALPCGVTELVDAVVTTAPEGRCAA